MKKIFTYILLLVGMMGITNLCIAKEKSILNVSILTAQSIIEDYTVVEYLLSPDGTKIAIRARAVPLEDLLVIDYKYRPEDYREIPGKIPLFTEDIFIMKFNGTDLRRVTDSRQNRKSYEVARWSPDNKKLLCCFNSEEFPGGAGGRGYTSQYFIMDVETGEILQNLPVDYRTGEGIEDVLAIEREWKQSIRSVIPKALSIGTHTFLIEEKEYYETKEVGLSSKKRIKKIHRRLLMGEKLLVDNIDRFAEILWAPDGKKFAITQKVEGSENNNKLWVISKTEEKKLISDMPAYHSNIQWFPDSKKLLFTASTQKGSDIFIATIEEGENE